MTNPKVDSLAIARQAFETRQPATVALELIRRHYEQADVDLTTVPDTSPQDVAPRRSS